jgi:hypothetical protein
VAADHLNIRGDLQGQVSLTPEEHADDRAARLKTERRGDLIRDCKDIVVIVVFTVLLMAIIIVGAIAAYEALWDASASPDTKRWSQTVLSSVMAGGISFVVGYISDR